MDNNHPIETVRPDGQLAVNCKVFVVQVLFFNNSWILQGFLWQVLYVAINIMDCFCMTMKNSKYKPNSQFWYIFKKSFKNHI